MRRFNKKTIARLITLLLVATMLLATFGTVVFAASTDITSTITVNAVNYGAADGSNPATNAIDEDAESYMHISGGNSYAIFDLGSSQIVNKVNASIYSDKNNAIRIVLSKELPSSDDLASSDAFSLWMAENTELTKVGSNFQSTDYIAKNYSPAAEARYLTFFKFYSGEVYLSELAVYAEEKLTGATVGVSSGTNKKEVPVEGDASIKVGDLYEVNKANIKVTMPNTKLGQDAVSGKAFPYNVIDSDMNTTLTGSATNDMLILDLGKAYDIDFVEVTYGTNSPNGQNYANYRLWLANELPDATILNTTPSGSGDDPFDNAFDAIAAKGDDKAKTPGCVGLDDPVANWKEIDDNTVTAKTDSLTNEYRYVIIQNSYRAIDIAEITVYAMAKQVINDDEDDNDDDTVVTPGNVAYKAKVIMTNAVMEDTQPASNAVDGKADTFFQTNDSADYVVYDMGAEYPIEKMSVSIYETSGNKVKITLSKDAPTTDDLKDQTAYDAWLTKEGVAVFNDEYNSFKADEFATKTKTFGVADAVNARYITVLKWYSGDLYISEIEALKAYKSEAGISNGTNLRDLPVQGDTSLTVGNRFEIDKANMSVILPNSDLGKKAEEGNAYPYNVIDSDIASELVGSVENDMIIIDLGAAYSINLVDIVYSSVNPNNKNFSSVHLFFSNELPSEDVLNTAPTTTGNAPYLDEFYSIEEAGSAARLGVVGCDDNAGDWKEVDGKTVKVNVGRATPYRYVALVSPYRALGIAEITVYSSQKANIKAELNNAKTVLSGEISGFSVEDAKTCQLMAVSYDVNGAATMISTKNLAIEMEEGVEYSEEYSLAVDEDAVDIKLFIWRNDGSITPVISPQIVLESK